MASGSSESWAYGRAGFPYAYTIELPDMSNFVIPTSKIAPTAGEWLNGLIYYLDHIENSEPQLYENLVQNITLSPHKIFDPGLVTSPTGETSAMADIWDSTPPTIEISTAPDSFTAPHNPNSATDLQSNFCSIVVLCIAHVLTVVRL